jgi:DNA-binding NarL/FixJ family response regulator
MTSVLIVDAQDSVRQTLRALARSAGLRVVAEANSIAAAEQQLRTTRPDLAILDFTLPGINGLVGITHLKAVQPDLRIILTSIHYSHALRTIALDSGAESCVAKERLDLPFLQSLCDP